MTLIRSLGQQWTKATLAHRLNLSLLQSTNVQQLFAGATSLSTVTHSVAALVFTQGQPIWLPPMDNTSEQVLSSELTLHCLFEASRLLFVKELEQGQLTQSEHLILAIANQWSTELQEKDSDYTNSHLPADKVQNEHRDGAMISDHSRQLCNLLKTINTQLEAARSQQRQANRNMGLNQSV